MLIILKGSEEKANSSQVGLLEGVNLEQLTSIPLTVTREGGGCGGEEGGRGGKGGFRSQWVNNFYIH